MLMSWGGGGGAAHLPFQLGLDDRRQVGALLVRAVQQVLQGAPDAVEEPVQHDVMDVPDFQTSESLSALKSSLFSSTWAWILVPVGPHLGVAGVHVGRADLRERKSGVVERRPIT